MKFFKAPTRSKYINANKNKKLYCHEKENNIYS